MALSCKTYKIVFAFLSLVCLSACGASPGTASDIDLTRTTVPGSDEQRLFLAAHVNLMTEDVLRRSFSPTKNILSGRYGTNASLQIAPGDTAEQAYSNINTDNPLCDTGDIVHRATITEVSADADFASSQNTLDFESCSVELMNHLSGDWQDCSEQTSLLESGRLAGTLSVDRIDAASATVTYDIATEEALVFTYGGQSYALEMDLIAVWDFTITSNGNVSYNTRPAISGTVTIDGTAYDAAEMQELMDSVDYSFDAICGARESA